MSINLHKIARDRLAMGLSNYSIQHDIPHDYYLSCPSTRFYRFSPLGVEFELAPPNVMMFAAPDCRAVYERVNVVSDFYWFNNYTVRSRPYVICQYGARPDVVGKSPIR